VAPCKCPYLLTLRVFLSIAVRSAVNEIPRVDDGSGDVVKDLWFKDKDKDV